LGVRAYFQGSHPDAGTPDTRMKISDY